jgi:hypothetical protein
MAVSSCRSSSCYIISTSNSSFDLKWATFREQEGQVLQNYITCPTLRTALLPVCTRGAMSTKPFKPYLRSRVWPHLAADKSIAATHRFKNSA